MCGYCIIPTQCIKDFLCRRVKEGITFSTGHESKLNQHVFEIPSLSGVCVVTTLCHFKCKVDIWKVCYDYLIINLLGHVYGMYYINKLRCPVSQDQESSTILLLNTAETKNSHQVSSLIYSMKSRGRLVH